MLIRIFLLLLFATKASASIVVLNGLTQEHKVEAGVIFKGSIKIKNQGNKASHINVYGEDLIPSCTEDYTYAPLSNSENSLSNWLKLSIEEKTLQPNEDYEILYSILIPKNFPNKKSVWQMIMVECGTPLKEENIEGINVQSKVRYGIQIIADIGNKEKSNLEFNSLKLKKEETPLLEIKLKNQSTFSNSAKVIIELYSTNGVFVKKIESNLKRIYPSFCATYILDLKDIKSGKYVGMIVADDGSELFAANMNLEI